jgi:hypothetical protein
MSAEIVQELKQQLLSLNRSSGIQRGSLQADAMDLALFCKEQISGFAGEVASTVVKSRRCSEKQAYVIAKAIVDKDGALRDFMGEYAYSQKYGQ